MSYVERASRKWYQDDEYSTTTKSTYAAHADYSNEIHYKPNGRFKPLPMTKQSDIMDGPRNSKIPINAYEKEIQYKANLSSNEKYNFGRDAHVQTVSQRFHTK
jgi:hypothetical protein